jgi:hypothetical protein
MPTAKLPKGFEAPPGSGSTMGEMAVAAVELTPVEGTALADEIREETPLEALKRLAKGAR